MIMANYELMMILNPSVGEENINASISGVKDALRDAGAKISNEDVWGEKKLAYKINRSETGYYILLTIEFDGSQIKDISQKFNLDGNIWRYMFVNLEA